MTGLDQDGRLLLRSRGVDRVQVSAYLVDAELLFTSDPFGQAEAAAVGGGGGAGGGGLGRVAFVKPMATAAVALDSGGGGGGGAGSGTAGMDALQSRALRLSELMPGLPDSSSVLVEVSGGGITRTAHR